MDCRRGVSIHSGRTKDVVSGFETKVVLVYSFGRPALEREEWHIHILIYL